MSQEETAALFHTLDHDDMLTNIFQFCSLSQLISEIMPTCKRWFRIALEFDNFIDQSQSFYNLDYENNFEEYCNSLVSQFTTGLTLFKPSRNHVEILVNCGSFKKLKTLAITSYESNVKTSCEMLQLVANSDISKNIQWLDLYRFRTDDEGLKIIAESNNFNKLNTLISYWNGFTIEGIKILSSHPKFSKLVKLEMTDLGGDEGFKLMCESPNFSNLTDLDIGMTSIGNEGMKYFASSPYLKKLKRLILDRCSFDAEGVRIMCSSENAASIEELEFEYTDIGDEGVKYLAQSPNMKNLTRLDITRTNSGNDCVQYIVNSPYLKKLNSISYEHSYSEDPYYEGKSIDEKEGNLLDKFMFHCEAENDGMR
ncbi:predicted protein [Naegleria gruberi]|uniref:Predicted protein n=1 Tax=Naegleria gruberi TaxID=5762 RepID=D2W034_NAEGR|nr:uncharacterized protein NAEGRDRAFT_74716 [Naegleria gruberi]EFC37546.1 predicted protein [Naegleria gruberi]|eukprot:XP_002670290.1 predicted protein [Naegleria gruberi strain NEG-M]